MSTKVLITTVRRGQLILVLNFVVCKGQFVFFLIDLCDALSDTINTKILIDPEILL